MGENGKDRSRPPMGIGSDSSHFCWNIHRFSDIQKSFCMTGRQEAAAPICTMEKAGPKRARLIFENGGKWASVTRPVPFR